MTYLKESLRCNEINNLFLTSFFSLEVRYAHISILIIMVFNVSVTVTLTHNSQSLLSLCNGHNVLLFNTESKRYLKPPINTLQGAMDVVSSLWLMMSPKKACHFGGHILPVAQLCNGGIGS